MKFKLSAFIVAILVLAPIHLYGQSDAVESLIKKYDEIGSHFAAEKVYIHFDKPVYYAGDPIWFKAYVLESRTNKPPVDSLNLYIEMVDQKGRIIEYLILLSENGTAWGNFKLSDSIPEGNYQFRAYTDKMSAFEKEMVFVRNFYITNYGYENIIPRADIRANRQFNNQLEKLSLSESVFFFPESGEIIAGFENRVGFKAIDGLGRGIKIVGDLVDSRGNVLARIDSRDHGYGIFSFAPVAGDNYKLRASLNGKPAKDYSLPVIQSEGYLLQLDYKESEISIQVKSTHMAEGVLVFQSRSGITFHESVILKDRGFTKSFSTSMFPGGINRVTLFSNTGLPLAERLFFVSPEQVISINASVFAQDHEGTKYLRMVVQNADSEGQPVISNLSMSLQDGDIRPVSSNGNILSYFLLSSELRGINPEGFGFKVDTETPVDSIDLVLLTHGWKRYSWREISRYNALDNMKQFQPGITLSGRIFDPVIRRYLANYPVQLLLRDDIGKSYAAVTDPDGVFRFSNLIFYGPRKVELNSRRTPNDVFPEIEIFVKENTSEPFQYGQLNRITDRGSNWRRTRGRYSAVSTGKGMMDEPKSMYGNPDQTIIIDDRLMSYRNTLRVLSDKAVGFTFQDGEVVFRGASSVRLSSAPVFVLDGNIIDQSTFLNMSPAELQRIEIFKGANAAIFGVRGTNGAVVGYSRRFTVAADGKREMVVMGLHAPAEFYTDVVPAGLRNRRNTDYVRTLHWNPQLTTDENGQAITIVPMPSGGSQLKLVIEGFGSKGELGFGEFIFNLK